ncbi:MAG TPA: hypothetical protein VEQ60_06985 [Longimicrobium sp.]|nr:hypothetical protein [Longimicrobium sp.]
MNKQILSLSRPLVLLAMGLSLGGTVNKAAYAAVIADKTYFAACSHTHGLSGHWYGPDRKNQADAQADATAHKQNTGHTDVGVLSQG